MNSQGFTPLHVALSRGCSTIVELLVEHGADINMADSDDSVPLLMLVYMREYAQRPSHLSPNLEKVWFWEWGVFLLPIFFTIFFFFLLLLHF